MLKFALVCLGIVFFLASMSWLELAVLDFRRSAYRYTVTAGLASLLHFAIGLAAYCAGIAAILAGAL